MAVNGDGIGTGTAKILSVHIASIILSFLAGPQLVDDIKKIIKVDYISTLHIASQMSASEATDPSISLTSSKYLLNLSLLKFSSCQNSCTSSHRISIS